jgi:choline dehydrogenase
LSNTSASPYCTVLIQSQPGGTAGCVLASRLSEDLGTSVLVLERGVANDTWLSRNPMISFNIFDPKFGAVSWKSEPLKHCGNRSIPLFTGEVLGGSSRINGTVYTRGSAADYDAWAAMGHTDWSYEKVLPYFVKAQTSINRPKTNYCGDSGA